MSDLTISSTALDILLLSRRLASEVDTSLGLTVKNLLDALEHKLVLGRLPTPLARATRRLMGT